MYQFIPSAVASTKSINQGDPYSLATMLTIFVLFFYFMVIRPQKKRAKQHKNLINSISQGDAILTAGGIVGVVSKVQKNGYITILINDSVQVVVKKDFITAVVPVGTMSSM